MSCLNLGNATEVFEKNYNSEKRIVINRGGTRSSKTYSICQLLVMWLFTGQITKNKFIPKGVANVVRKYRATTGGPVERTFNDVLKSVKINDQLIFEKLIQSKHLNINQSKKIYSYKGRIVEFLGADNEQKLKGTSPNILYCNEADELDYKKEFFQLNIRTKDVVFLDLNPSDPYIFINTELEQKRAQRKGDVEVIVSTYLENYENLNKVQIEEIEDLAEVDQSLWQVYGLGQYGKIKGLIFPDIILIDSMPTGLKRIAFPMDFGFSKDPTTLYMCGIKGRNLYVDELCYRSGMLTTDIHAEFKKHKINFADDIVGDSAEPRTIADLQLYGWNIFGCQKGKDSIRAGINILKGYKIHITKRSAGILKEQKKYKWKVNKTGELVKDNNGKAVPIDAFNHGFDPLRYYALEYLDKPFYESETESEVF